MPSLPPQAHACAPRLILPSSIVFYGRRQIFALAVEHEQLKRRVAVLEQALSRLAPDLFDEFAATASTSASYSMHQLPAMALPVPPPLNPPKGSNRPRTRRKRGEARQLEGEEDEDAEARDHDEMDSEEEGTGGDDDEEEEDEGGQDEYETDDEVVEGAAHALKGLGTSEKKSLHSTAPHREGLRWVREPQSSGGKRTIFLTIRLSLTLSLSPSLSGRSGSEPPYAIFFVICKSASNASLFCDAAAAAARTPRFRCQRRFFVVQLWRRCCSSRFARRRVSVTQQYEFNSVLSTQCAPA